MGQTRKLPLAYFSPIFLVGLVALGAVLAPFYGARSSGAGKIFFFASVFSAIVCVAYMIAVRTFLSGYTRRSLTFAFSPFILATFVLGAFGIFFLIWTLAHFNIL